MNDDGNHKRAKALGDRPGIVAKAKASAEDTFALARKYHDAGAFEDAEILYRKILQAVPEHAGSTQFLGVISLQRGRIDEGLDLLRRSIAYQPQEAQFHTNIGVAFQKLGRFYEAECAHCRVIQLKPNHAVGHYNLGLSLQMQNRFAEAEVAYRRAATLRPNHAMTHNNLGNVLHKQEKLEESEACYRYAIEIAPDNPNYHYNLGRVLEDQQKLEAAAAAHGRAIDLNPRHARAHNSVGNVFLKKGQTKEAETAFHRALTLEPNLAVANYNFAVVHKFAPNDPVIDQFKRILNQDTSTKKQRDYLLAALGKAHDDIGKYAEAFSYYRQAMEEISAELTYDVVRHREQITSIKNIFARWELSSSVELNTGGRVPIFVVGMPRSGKTLIESLLSGHDKVYGAGERQEWFNAVKIVLNEHGISQSWPECSELMSDAMVTEIGERYMADIAKVSPASRFFVNTLPGHYLGIGPILRSLPSAKIIYARRDALDHCLYVYFKRFAHGNPYSYNLEDLGSYYVGHHDLMEYWLRLLGDRILCVQYEELVRDPMTVGARLYEYCGLEFDPKRIRADLTPQEIGHAKNYAPFLVNLRRTLRSVITYPIEKTDSSS